MKTNAKNFSFLFAAILLLYAANLITPTNSTSNVTDLYPNENSTSIRGNGNNISQTKKTGNQIFTLNVYQEFARDKSNNGTDNNPLAEEIKLEKRGPKNNTVIREAVKLSMKQGLIMNQILSTYSLTEVNSSLCRNHISEFKIGLRAFEPWALKMFDSSSKLMSGILNGNLAELGTFRECLNIYEETVYGPIKGRYCSLKITPTNKLMQIILGYRKVSRKFFGLLKDSVLDNVKITWSVCVPDSCTHEDVFKHYNKIILETTYGLNLTVSLEEKHCVSIDDLPDFTFGDYLYLAFVCFVIGTVIVCSLFDVINKDSSKTTFRNIFSLKSNSELLFSVKEGKNEIACLHGLRFISMCYIVAGHRYIHNMATPVVNSMDLVDWIHTYFSAIVHGGTVSVDTFLLVSSTLASYNLCISISKGTKFNILTFYLYRNARIMMPLVLAIATYATVMKHFGSGPLYHDFNFVFQKPCQMFWWSTIFNIQVFVNPKFLCIAQTWYLSVDMFCYYVSPLIILPLLRKPVIGYLILISGYIISVVVSFYQAWVYKFDGGMPVTPRLLQTDYFAYYYIQPLCRASPYILGLSFGYALFKTKDQNVTMEIFANTAGWILASGCLTSVVLISYLFRQESYEYNRVFSSLFLAGHRSIWVLAIMWIIWCCGKGYGGVVNLILSHYIFKIFGRLSYIIYLFHYVFQAAMENSKKTPGYFSNFIAIYMAVADIVLMVILAIPISLCFEYPFIRMFGLAINQRTRSRKIGPESTG